MADKFSAITYAAAKKMAADSLTGAGAIKGQKGDTGAKGEDGFSPSVTAERVDGGVRVTVTNKAGTASVIVNDGAKGDKGDKGDRGEDGSPGIQVTAFTLAASGWSGGEYSLEEQYPSSSLDISVMPDGDGISEAGIMAWADAMIAGSGTGNSLKALGVVPAVDIPVLVKAVNK